MKIIARSRIGFWSAFTVGGASYLNIRDEDGEGITVVLTDHDVALLGDDAEVCHPHARQLAKYGNRLAIPLPTPLRGFDEPEAHEWTPSKTIDPRTALLKVA